MTGARVVPVEYSGGSWSAADGQVLGTTMSARLASALAATNRTRAWVMPALVDAHRHLPHSHTPTPTAEIATARSERLANLRSVGVLGVTDMGAAEMTPWLDQPLGVRSAICGLEGPSRWPRPAFAMMIDTPSAAQRAVEQLAEAGATLLKIFATASGRLPADNAISATIGLDVLAEAIRRARDLRLPIAVHCHGGLTLNPALDAGTASIEHGLYLSGDDLRRLAETGTDLVMTPLVYIRRHGDPMRARMRQLFEDARAAGVTVRLGTDSEQWGIADEIVAMVDVGLDPGEVLASVAPQGAGDLESVLDEHGAIVVDGDPRVDPTTLLRPIAVIPRGLEH